MSAQVCAGALLNPGAKRVLERGDCLGGRVRVSAARGAYSPPTNLKTHDVTDVSIDEP